jgi:hypothetical protein
MRYQPADRPVRSVFRTSNLGQRGRLVLGANLKCSESRGWPAPHVPLTRTRIAHGEGLDGHVEEGCTNHAFLDFTCLSGHPPRRGIFLSRGGGRGRTLSGGTSLRAVSFTNGSATALLCRWHTRVLPMSCRASNRNAHEGAAILGPLLLAPHDLGNSHYGRCSRAVRISTLTARLFRPENLLSAAVLEASPLCTEKSLRRWSLSGGTAR